MTTRKTLIIAGFVVWIVLLSSFFVDLLSAFWDTSAGAFLRFDSMMAGPMLAGLVVYTLWLVTAAIRDWDKPPRKVGMRRWFSRR